MTTRTRRTLDQQIADIEAKLKKLQSKKSGAAEKPELTRDSEGMNELLAAFDHVSASNKVKSAEVIALLARIKRTRISVTPRKSATE